MPENPIKKINGIPEDIFDSVEPNTSPNRPLPPMGNPPAGSRPQEKNFRTAPPPPNLPSSLKPQAGPPKTIQATPQIPQARPQNPPLDFSPRPRPRMPGPGIPEGLKIKENFAPAPREPEERETHRKKPKMFLIAGLLVLVLGALCYGGYYVYTLNIARQGDTMSGEDLTNKEEIPATDLDVNSSANPSGEDTIPVQDVPGEQNRDSDYDGLSDEEEGLYGTNISLFDTDDDGLTDRDEVKAYGTDPLNPDTDGDGFKDGEEVANRYNPKGEGRLFENP